MKVSQAVKAEGAKVKFKVAMKLPEHWKIKAIADFKSKKKGQVDTNVSKNKAISSNINATASTTAASSSTKKHGDPVKGSEVAKEHSTLSRPTLVERSVKELEYWNTRSIVAKERIASLHSVKNSLLWLLKKATSHERSLINDYPPSPNM